MASTVFTVIAINDPYKPLIVSTLDITNDIHDLIYEVCTFDLCCVEDANSNSEVASNLTVAKPLTFSNLQALGRSAYNHDSISIARRGSRVVGKVI